MVRWILRGTVGVLVALLYATIDPTQFVFLPALVVNQAAQAAPSGVTISTSYYSVKGSTEAQLAEQLATQGPLDGDTRFAARTDWRLTWSYRYHNAQQVCTLTTARVDVQLTYIYPQWNAPAGVAPQLIERWQAFLAALSLHEHQHGALAVAGGEQLQAALLAMPPTPCPQIAAATRAIADQVLAQTNQLQRDYDKNTQHGATQGAVW